MPLGLHNASVGLFVRHLEKLSGIIDKGAAFAEAKKLDPAVLLATRLYPDMWALGRQIQEVNKHVYWACSLLSGQERKDVAAQEGLTFAQLKESVAKTVEYAKSIPAGKIDGGEGRAVVLAFPQMKLDFTGESYLFTFAIPNFFFHLTSVYGILRHVGCDVGKRDFLAIG